VFLGDSSGTASVSPEHHRIACVEPVLRPKVEACRVSISCFMSEKVNDFLYVPFVLVVM